MTDYWLENYLFPSKKPSSKGYLEEDWFYVHKELLKKNMTLRLLHREYELKAKLAHKFHMLIEHTALTMATMLINIS